MVESVRVGFIIARDSRAYARWRTRAGVAQAVKPQDLDKVIGAIALRFPQNVKVN